ncbi:hypothetical protein Golax_018293 [Gossypium laxum]|uniref:Uncharacterized protein n=1 Tax=Gossypium laxum TaxID=34288 RepID=A0A7J8Z2T9_9ROSI|nr:hypothetical protein [Gossypium laxum]
MAVNKYINGKELQPKSCLVRLVSSPHLTCNIPTNFAGGITGVNLPVRPTVLYRDLVQYQLGTFFYTTPRCAKPAAGRFIDLIAIVFTPHELAHLYLKRYPK